MWYGVCVSRECKGLRRPQKSCYKKGRSEMLGVVAGSTGVVEGAVLEVHLVTKNAALVNYVHRRYRGY